ncbi:hypothetical protein NC651_033617 [Populus alba x Populus x berolinensis]|nr:hypothetical protein NC651_033617 [Populus alba x Populus x berolinensis]
MAYHLRLDFNLIKGFAIVVEGGAEADTPVKWCLSPWQRKGGWCKTDHDERTRWFPLVCLLGEWLTTLRRNDRVWPATRWSSLRLVAAVVGYCSRCSAIEGETGLCAVERGKGEQRG